MREAMDRAQSLDRRRQAQIKNQVETINRLLSQLTDHDCRDILQDGDALLEKAKSGPAVAQAAYTEEMQILHEGAAVLMAERDEAREALAELVRAIDGVGLDQFQLGRNAGTMRLAEALAAARRHEGPASKHEVAPGHSDGDGCTFPAEGHLVPSPAETMNVQREWFEKGRRAVLGEGTVSAPVSESGGEAG